MPLELHVLKSELPLETFRIQPGIHTLGSGKGADLVLAAADAPDALCQVELGPDGEIILRSLDDRLLYHDGLDRPEVSLRKSHDHADLGDFRLVAIRPPPKEDKDLVVHLPMSPVATAPTEGIDTPTSDRLALKITVGEKERTYVVDQPELSIGRGEGNDIEIEGPNISRRHARMVRMPDGVHIQDLGSGHGTYLNDVKLEPGARWEEYGVVRLSADRKAGPTLQLMPESDALSGVGLDETLQPIRGMSEPMVFFRAALSRCMDSADSVVLMGPTGSGKELAAQALGKKRGPLVVVTCGVTQDSLIEAALFGTVKGGYTGAVDRAGAMELARGGTLFIDEIGELSLLAQVRLLRALESREFTRVGDTKVRKLEARVVLATHRNLAAMVEAGTFRQDLWHRISVLIIKLPPLRERLGDIPVLARAILAQREGKSKGKRLTPEALAKLEAYSWPGNVRELKNTLDRAAVYCDDVEIPAEKIMLLDELEADLAAKAAWADTQPRAKAGLGNLSVQLAAFERDFCAKALAEAGGHVSRAARSVGEKESTFRSRLIRFELLAKKGEQ